MMAYLQQLPDLSRQDALAAIQAQIVYFIMRVVDSVGRPLQWDAWNQEMAQACTVSLPYDLDT